MTCEFDCFSPLLPVTSDMARTVYQGDASAIDWQFSWPYLDQADFDSLPLQNGRKYSRYVRVFTGSQKDGVAENTSFTMPNSSTVRITPAVPNDHYILILRDSKVAETMVDFEDDGTLTQETLDLSYRHNLYLHQENRDRITDVDCRLNTLCGITNAGNGGPTYQFNGDCTSTEFELDDGGTPYGAQSDLGEEDILVFINGILQPPGCYQIDNTSGTSTVVLDVALTNTDILFVKVISNARIAYQVQGTGIADGAVTTAKLADGAVTPQKMGFSGYGSIRQVWQNTDGTNWAAATLTPTSISGFDTQVRTSRLDQMAIPTANLNANTYKIINLATGVASTDAANTGQVNALNQSISNLEDLVSGGYDQGEAGIMPDLYYRASYQTTRAASWSDFYAGTPPKVALSTRSGSEKLLIGFVPRRITLLMAGQIRRASNANVIHGWTNFTRVFQFVRWDPDDWFATPNASVYDGQYQTFTLSPLDAGTWASSPLTNITVKLEIDFTNAITWLYIYGSGFGTELMRLVNPSNINEAGVVQLTAERGY